MWLFFPQPPLFILPPPAEKKINDRISHSYERVRKVAWLSPGLLGPPAPVCCYSDVSCFSSSFYAKNIKKKRKLHSTEICFTTHKLENKTIKDWNTIWFAPQPLKHEFPFLFFHQVFENIFVDLKCPLVNLKVIFIIILTPPIMCCMLSSVHSPLPVNNVRHVLSLLTVIRAVLNSYLVNRLWKYPTFSHINSAWTQLCVICHRAERFFCYFRHIQLDYCWAI